MVNASRSLGQEGEGEKATTQGRVSGKALFAWVLAKKEERSGGKDWDGLADNQKNTPWEICERHSH